MEKKINNVLLITTKTGEKLVFRVLFTYYSETFGKDYAVFYNEKDENDLIVYSFDKDYTLSPVGSKEEYTELEAALRKYDEEASGT